MKHYLSGIFTILLITIFSTLQVQAQQQIDLPVTFEGDTTDFTLTDFEGASSVVGQDPTDSTNTVGITTKTQGAATFAGTTIGTNLGFASVIPFTAEETKVSVLVYSPKSGVQVRLKVEDHNDNTLTAETEATTKNTGWQKLVFDFSNVAAGTNPFNLSTNFDMMTIFFDFGAAGVGDVYYFDEVRFGEGTPGSDVSLASLKVDDVTIEGFTPTTASYIIELAEGDSVVPAVTAWATDTLALVVITPAEGVPGTTSILVTGVDGFTKANYNVTFKLPATEYPPLSLPIDFEEGPYGFVDFDGGVANVISNPQSNEGNNSSTVAQIIKNDGAVWAGSKLILAEKIDFTTNNSFTMKVFSPRADMPILFKLEGPGAATPDNIVNTTKANEWETIEWDYTGTPSDVYDALVFMFDFGTAGDGSANFTFLFDDVMFYDNTGGLSRIDLPVSFEDNTVNYDLTDFEGAETVLVADPDDSGNTVAATTRPGGSGLYAGTTIGTNFGFATVIPFTANETRVSIRTYSPESGIQVRLKVEDHNNAALTAETDVMTTVANAWETLVFDLSDVAPGTNPFNLATNFDKMSVFFDFETNGNGEVFHWDQVTFGGMITSSESSDDIATPFKTELVGSYPNPFNPATNIQYSVDNAQDISVDVFNINGQKVATLFSGRKSAGEHTLKWDAGSYASGVYFVRLISNSNMSTIKLMLQK